MDVILADRVRSFVCDFWNQRPDRLRSATRLEEDLGMTGDDAAEFLEAFARQFEVDLAALEFHKHFGPESGPVVFWPRRLAEELKDWGHFPVTIGHLVAVAAARRWTCPPRQGGTTWAELPPLGVRDEELDR